MNILDQKHRPISCNGQTFMSLAFMKARHPEMDGKDWHFVDHGSWMMDPYTGNILEEADWEMMWLEESIEAWNGLSWDEVRMSLMPVVIDWSDPEQRTFISYEMAEEMMKACDPELHESIKREPCIDATLQDVWDAFWAFQNIKSLKQDVHLMSKAAYDMLMDYELDSIHPEMQNR